ncbi:CopY/TcrY family copper transport repressor [Streptococcus iniae]|uniref:CopY/TcrY family copper transport repressor n=1 Tax=Streptococcus iniae TaxID=1346 RepID=A0A3L8GCC0_STRIN|nr:CopY/TcrY family copper transport repressor [Streptococcus iniae]AGM99461.1 putative negative transcriptional regulator [Streptococcus iniae SF1]AHY16390.1 uracil phosphoribosyltransferase [Streptococcus iniae]AHY18253.1 uracil phosphoribosyltransferase [Streptococcus iniae]AJG26537.1 uracil phosphoribosyltransferase [Streptococcus iniae]APD32412.1 uracil phosphoribosyltransferase [Streptococcus iniae]
MQTISEAEWEVMRVIWARKQLKSSDIIDILQEKFQWSPSTIKTLLGRLVDKKLVGTQKSGRAFLYESLVNEKDYQEKLIQDGLNHICQRKHASLLLKILKAMPMTKQDIADFQELLREKEVSTVGKVPCNCIPGQCRCDKEESHR